MVFDKSDHTLPAIRRVKRDPVKRTVAVMAERYTQRREMPPPRLTECSWAGLGPRSYSIIEQGLIRQIIEAKPRIARLPEGEAAYPSTRRGARNRDPHPPTRENLDSLRDLIDEVGSRSRPAPTGAQPRSKPRSGASEGRDAEWKARSSVDRNQMQRLAGCRRRNR